MNWIARSAPPPIQPRGESGRRVVPDRVWSRCDSCRATLFDEELLRNLHVCPRCGHHAAIGARSRLASLLKAGTATEIGSAVVPCDALRFEDSSPYTERLERAQAASSESEALVAQTGLLCASTGIEVAIACFDYRFMGGSMGSVVGERFVRAVDVACERRLPFVCITASGGARMQEGLYSLMQMGKTTAAIAQLRRAGLPFVSILSNPTMGGVSASFAFLADIVVAEPGALIGFAGPRVIEQTLRTKLPAGFQRAEFLLEKGSIDLIVDRRQQPQMLHRTLGMLRRDCPAQIHLLETEEKAS